MEGIQQIESTSEYWSFRRKSKEILRKRNFHRSSNKEDNRDSTIFEMYDDAYKFYTASYNYTRNLRNILDALHVRIGYANSEFTIIIKQKLQIIRWDNIKY